MPDNKTLEYKNYIAIVGGGVGTLLAAMLRKNPENHITLIERDQYLLNAATKFGWQSHNGGEYIFDSDTYLACIESSILPPILLPSNSYLPENPTQFLIDAGGGARWVEGSEGTTSGLFGGTASY